MLSKAIQSIKGDKRPTICFLCLRNPLLTIRKRVKSYATSSSLGRHFLRKYVSKLQGGAYVNCQTCDVRLESRVQLLIHAEKFHRTVSRGPAERLLH